VYRLTVAPRPPTEALTPDLDTFSHTPGRTLTRQRKRKPTTLSLDAFPVMIDGGGEKKKPRRVRAGLKFQAAGPSVIARRWLA